MTTTKDMALADRLEDTTRRMANSCSVPMTLWDAHSNAALEAVAALRRASSPAVVEREGARPAFWTHDDEAVEDAGHLYYFAPTNRSPGPYTKQRHVKAIIDIADDGTLAGVELIDDMPPPPESILTISRPATHMSEKKTC